MEKTEKTTWAEILELIPTLLKENGQYIRFGPEKESLTLTITRNSVGDTDCWIIADCAEASTAFVMNCSSTAEGYTEDLRQWLAENWFWGWSDDVWTDKKVFDQNGKITAE